MIIKRPTNTLYSRLSNRTGPVLSRATAVAAVLAGSLSLGSSIIIPHTIAQQWTLSRHQANRNGIPLHPTSKVQQLVETAMTDLKYSEAERSSVKIFSVVSEKCEVFGSVKTAFGALIGLPAHLNAQIVEDVSLENLAVSPTQDKEKLSLSQKLRESSLLSDKAKLYVIAEGLAQAREYTNFALRGVASSLCFIAAFFQSSVIINYTHFKTRPLIFKLPVYIISIAMWIGTYKFVTDSVSYNQDKYILRYLGDLGENYIEGGIEYYERMLASNQIINQLHPFSYFENGDLLYLAFPFSQRLSELQKRQGEKQTS